MSSDFKSQVISVIERYDMLAPGDTVIVGVSGGADSMALISVLIKIKSEYNLHIIAAHINHGLRGDEALRDEQFVCEFCKAHGIECRVLHARVPELASQRGESFEECGRRVRYEFFADIAKDVVAAHGTIKIATAHNAQDTVETMLFNLARGTGLKGLAGIPPKREFSSLMIIRPLIECTREEIEKYLSENGTEYVTDSTNLQDEYARNRIRLNILPEFEKINPGAVRNMARCAVSLRDDESYIAEQAAALLDGARLPQDAVVSEQRTATGTPAYNAATLRLAPPAVRARAVADALRCVSGTRPEKLHIDAVCELLCTGGATQVAGGLYVAVRDDLLCFPQLPIKSQDFGEFRTEICLNTSEYTDNFLGAQIKLSLRTYEEFKTENYKQMLENSLDYDKISSTFVLRNRLAGDKFRLPKRHITKSLKNLFNEFKIPIDDRERMVILESDGEIVFLEKFGVSEKYLITEDTKNVLTIDISRR